MATWIHIGGTRKCLLNELPYPIHSMRTIKLKNKKKMVTKEFFKNHFLQATFVKFLFQLVVQMVKRLPAIQENQIRSPGWEDLLEKEMATHSSIPAWRIPGTEDPGRLQSMGSQRVGHDWATSLHFTSICNYGLSSWSYSPCF